jgi:DNA-directed RNA polymerase beta subunit
LDDIKERLKKAGFVGNGKEKLRSGTTGQLIDGMVFMGPVPIMKLPHIAEAKMHARNGNPHIYVVCRYIFCFCWPR